MFANYSPITVSLFLFTYIVTPLSLYCFFQNMARLNDNKQKLVLLTSCLGLGPLSVGWILTMQLMFLPGLPKVYYITSIILLYLLPFLSVKLQLKELLSQLNLINSSFTNILKNNKGDLLLFCISLCFILVAFILSIYLPFSENDALEYAYLAKIIANASSVNMYPIFDGTPYNGFIAPFTHPLGYSSLFVWSYWIQGTTESFGLIRIVAPYFATCTYLLILSIGIKEKKSWMILAGFLFIATPLFYSGIFRHQIDPLRIFTFFNFFILIPLLKDRKLSAKSIILGTALGMCLFSHSFNILSIPIFIFLYCLLSSDAIKEKLKTLLFTSFVGLLFVLPRYIINIKATGKLISDGTSVRLVPSLHFSEIYELSHHISSFAEKWLNGFLDLFYDTLNFGITYLLTIIAILLLAPKLLKNIKSKNSQKIFNIEYISLIVMSCFYGMVILSILIHNNNFIATYRYMMSMQPFAAIISAWAIYQFIPLIKNFYLKHFSGAIFTVSTVFLCTIYPVNYLHNYKMSFNTINDTDFAKASLSQDSYLALDYINQKTPQGSKILSFRNAETAFYGGRQYLYHSSPIMKKVYESKTIEGAFKNLSDLGINYIITQQYAVTYIDHSFIKDIIGDPTYSNLIYSHNQTKIFKLNTPLKTRLGINQLNSYTPRSDKSLKYWLNNKNHKYNVSHSETLPVKIENRSSYGSTTRGFIFTKEFLLKPNTTYQAKLKLKGKGDIGLLILQSDQPPLKNQEDIQRFTLLSLDKTIIYPIQFRASEYQASKYWFTIDLYGKGKVEIQGIDINEVKQTASAEELAERSKTKQVLKGWKIYEPPTVFKQIINKAKSFITHKEFSDIKNYNNWEIKKKNNTYILTITPINSIDYTIIPPQLNLTKDAAIKIKGTGNISLTLLDKNDHEIIRRAHTLENIESVIQNIPQNIGTNKIHKIKIKYRKDLHRQKGYFKLQIPVALLNK